MRILGTTSIVWGGLYIFAADPSEGNIAEDYVRGAFFGLVGLALILLFIANKLEKIEDATK